MKTKLRTDAKSGTRARFTMPIRVYYEDTDAAGIVYHANYLNFAERARTEMLRHAGIEQSNLRRATGLYFAVSRCDMHFVAPATLDDALEVDTIIDQIGGASIHAEQIVRRGDDTLVRMRLRLACINSKGRPARVPASVRTALDSLDATISGEFSEMKA